jgi:pimeloyl-ACP methyl ester carboxylesterase
MSVAMQSQRRSCGAVADVGRRYVTYIGFHGTRLAADMWSPAVDIINPTGAVLLLHGGGQTRHSWQATAYRLAANGWLAITVDARGHGDSQWAPDRDYSIDAFVGDVYAIAAALDRRPVLVGASLGGMTALVAQGERSSLGSALVLVDITPRVEPAGRDRIRAFMTGAPDGFASLDEVADAVQAYNPHRSRPRSLEGLKKNVRQRANGRWYWHWDPAFLASRDAPTRALDVPRLYQAARDITVPTLLVRGNRSDIVSADGAAELLELIPSARSVDAAAGHMVAGDNNDVFTKDLLNFLSEHAAA